MPSSSREARKTIDGNRTRMTDPHINVVTTQASNKKQHANTLITSTPEQNRGTVISIDIG